MWSDRVLYNVNLLFLFLLVLLYTCNLSCPCPRHIHISICRSSINQIVPFILFLSQQQYNNDWLSLSQKKVLPTCTRRYRYYLFCYWLLLLLLLFMYNSPLCRVNSHHSNWWNIYNCLPFFFFFLMNKKGERKITQSCIIMQQHYQQQQKNKTIKNKTIKKPDKPPYLLYLSGGRRHWLLIHI